MSPAKSLITKSNIYSTTGLAIIFSVQMKRCGRKISKDFSETRPTQVSKSESSHAESARAPPWADKMRNRRSNTQLSRVSVGRLVFVLWGNSR